jgi:hypothetical protein
MFQARRFSFAPFAPSLPGAQAAQQRRQAENALVVFLHAEAEDEGREKALLGRVLKNVKWLAGKRELRRVVLHSFGHLSESKASAEFAERFLGSLEERLAESGFAVWLTPFGYTCEWELSVFGESIAKVFKTL